MGVGWRVFSDGKVDGVAFNYDSEDPSLQTGPFGTADSMMPSLSAGQTYEWEPFGAYVVADAGPSAYDNAQNDLAQLSTSESDSIRDDLNSQDSASDDTTSTQSQASSTTDNTVSGPEAATEAAADGGDTDVSGGDTDATPVDAPEPASPANDEATLNGTEPEPSDDSPESNLNDALNGLPGSAVTDAGGEDTDVSGIESTPSGSPTGTNGLNPFSATPDALESEEPADVPEDAEALEEPLSPDEDAAESDSAPRTRTLSGVTEDDAALSEEANADLSGKIPRVDFSSLSGTSNPFAATGAGAGNPFSATAPATVAGNTSADPASSESGDEPVVTRNTPIASTPPPEADDDSDDG